MSSFISPLSKKLQPKIRRTVGYSLLLMYIKSKLSQAVVIVAMYNVVLIDRYLNSTSNHIKTYIFFH